MNKQQWIFVAALTLIATLARAQTVEYIHTDALGSPVAVTNASGAVIERTVYEPYGAVVNRPLTNGPGYTGHAADAVTGLNYMQQRYYDPQLGRFLSSDPVSATTVGGNFNRYWYANNNPYAYIDPDGRCSTGTIIKREGGSCPAGSRVTMIGGVPDSGGDKSGTKGGVEATASDDTNDCSDCEADTVPVYMMSVGYLGTPIYTNVPVTEADEVQRLYMELNLNTAEAAGTVLTLPFAPARAAEIRTAVGPLKQWIRLGPSYSKTMRKHITLSLRWGASPTKNGIYLRQIGSTTLQRVNQWLRERRIPIESWRTVDSGHLHLLE